MDYKKIIKSRETRLLILRLLSFVPDRIMLHLQYRIKLNRKLDLKNPIRYTEKIQWYKLYYRDKKMIQCVDKYDVREYISNRGYNDLLVKCYGVYNSADEINFSTLPNQFVMKSTLGGGGNSVFICEDKSKCDINALKKKAEEWIKPKLRVRDGGREWPYYTGKKPRIIIEELIVDDNDNGLIDYKFTCCNGNVKCVFVLYDRNLGQNAKMTTYNRNFENLHVSELAELEGDGVPKPKNYKKMIEISEELAKDFPLVRVDLYNSAGKIFFGELTFYDESGYTQFVPDDFDVALGKQLKLPLKKNNLKNKN